MHMLELKFLQNLSGLLYGIDLSDISLHSDILISKLSTYTPYFENIIMFFFLK